MENSEFEIGRRVDDLARELLKSGACSSRADAHLRAEQIVLGEIRTEGLEQGEASATKPEVVANDDLVSNERLLTELGHIRTKVDEQLREILLLKEAISEIKTKVKAPVVEIQRYKEEPKEEKTQLFRELKKEDMPQQRAELQQEHVEHKRFSPEEGGEVESTTHPRSGSYTPKDVAIDKFFYYGNKPQE